MRAIQYGMLTAMFYAFALPATIGIFDSWAYLVVGQQLSWIEWTWLRGWIASMLLAPALLCEVAKGWMRDAADR